MRIDTQFSIFLINRPGVLAAVTKALAAAGVNVFALSLSDSGEHGVLRIVTDDPDKTREVLNAEHDRWTETDVLLLPIGNEPGTFAKIVETLADASVNVTYAYCTATESGGQTTAVFKIADIETAQKLLKNL